MEAYFQYRAFAPKSTPHLPTYDEQSLEHPKSPIIYVSFDSDDPRDPQNWSGLYKTFVIGSLSFLTLSLTFASSVSAAAEEGMMAEFGCSQLAATAATSMFLIGLGLGAMPFAPLSELYGRLPVYLITIFLATVFQIACAVAPNLPALLILRLIAGVWSTTPLSNAGGSLNDVGDPVLRTIAMPLFSTAGFLGPCLGPIIGGFVAQNPAYGWRWCYWVCAIWNGLAFLLCFFFMPETLSSALLKFKAVAYRRATGQDVWRARIEDETFGELTPKYLWRPFKMLGQEPVVQFFIAYLLVVYTVLYGFFDAYPIVFKKHGLTGGKGGLMFVPVQVGFLLLMIVNLLHWKRYRGLARDAKAGVERRGIKNGKIEPEERLIPLMLCSWLLPASMFWFAWTSGPEFNFWVPMMSGLPFGIGLLSIFQGSFQYLIDAYGPFAASALSGSTLVRYGVTGLVILAFPTMYESLGDQWATSLFAFIGLALTAVPFVFYLIGHRIRAKCRFTVRD
ncbi:MFS multidrug transporter [Cryptococcus wingfieldii CBS 7118]|uniref:MFS multidrug transporter n=1 Tax=Cryptococcus wingfieldii CBS 7118 TaxID=1295528 RepID=A0A1E3K6G1_9TREE|nr:MFS multidrug transporter [Cryptococcus wingfieldii CBS 7118]ODO08669.1 MFS multidrug transporter [Cryptococcus wingfieldii CBS 7118]